MQALTAETDFDHFFERVRRASERVLFLDYDGTVAPFHVQPERAAPYPGVAQLVRDLRARGTRVVIVSGRCLADLQGPLRRLHHDDVWASHGWQRCTPNGVSVEFEPRADAMRQLDVAEASALGLGIPGARVERKVASVAMHWRGLPPATAHSARAGIFEKWRELASGELDLLHFEGGLEVRARGRNKGDAVREVLAECPSDAACAYLGDDLTDEDAFAALDGRGLGVLVRRALRSTRAHAWVRPPSGLLTFLYRWRAAAAA